MAKVKMVRDISEEEDCDFWSGSDRSPAKKKARKEELKTRQLEAPITPCTQCEKSFKGTVGLKIHTARKHTAVTGTPKLVANEECNDVRESMKKDSRNSPPSSSLPPPWSPPSPPPETSLLSSGYGEYIEEEDEEEYEEKPVVNFDKMNCYRELVGLHRNKEYEEKTMIKELQEVMVKQKLEMNALTMSQNLVERCENSSQQQEVEEMKKIQFIKSRERKKELHKKFDDERQGIIKRCNARISDIHSEVKTIEETLLKVLHQTYLGEKRRSVKKEADPSDKENIDTIVQPHSPDEDTDAGSEIIDNTGPQSATTGGEEEKEEDDNIDDIDAIQVQLQKDNFSDISDDEDSDTEEEVSCKVEIIDTSDEDCEIETRVEADDNEEKRLSKEDFIPSLSLSLSHSTSLHKTMEQLWMKKCRIDICPISATDLLKAWKNEKDNSEDEFTKIIDTEDEDEEINELIDRVTELWERYNNIC